MNQIPATPFPMARKTDPATSHQAAAQHRPKLSLRRQQVFDLVLKRPGKTSGELSRLFLDEYHVPIRTAAETPHKRLPELETLGYVRRGPKRKCSDSCHEAITWWPETRQLELL